MPNELQKNFQCKTGTIYILEIQRYCIELEIEVDPTAGVQTGSLFWLGTTSSLILTEADQKLVKKQGNIYSIPVCDMFEGVTAYVRPCKSGLLKKYDTTTGEAVFQDTLYPTAELFVEINLFVGMTCLTGTVSFDDVKKKMKKTRIRNNRLLIRLDDTGQSIQDFIIDGTVYWEAGEQKVKTAREP